VRLIAAAQRRVWLVLNPLAIPGLRAGTCCAVLRGSLLIVWYWSIQLQSCKCDYNKNLLLTYLRISSECL